MTSQWEIKWKYKDAWLKLGKEKRKQSTNDATNRKWQNGRF